MSGDKHSCSVNNHVSIIYTWKISNIDENEHFISLCQAFYDADVET